MGRDSLLTTAYFAPVARKARIDARRQSWNVAWNQEYGGIFARVREIMRTLFAKPRSLDFCIPLIRRCLNGNLADTPQPTEAKTRKNTLFQTPTTSRAFLFRINNIPETCGLGSKPECTLESSKRGLHVRRNQTKCGNGNVLWNQRHELDSTNARIKNNALKGSGNVV